MIKTIMGAVERNEEEIKGGEAKQEQLEGEMKRENARMRDLQVVSPKPRAAKHVSSQPRRKLGVHA